MAAGSLHAGGAIGATGPVDGVAVELEGGSLAYLILPPIADLVTAVRIALTVLDLHVTLAASAWRAPLIEFYPSNFSPWTAGPTGVLKSAAWGISQSFYGSYWNGVHFPLNWSGTANYMGKVTFIAKDMLILADDFAPGATRHAVADAQEKAGTIIRETGNLGGRGRMNSDSSLRITYWPRCLVAVTGEDVPSGHSVRTRLFIDQFVKGDIDIEKLSRLQAAGAAGQLAEAMAGYVQWVARHAEGGELGNRLQKRQSELRPAVSAETHLRTPDAIAALGLGIDTFLNFAVDCGAIDAEGREALWQRARVKLGSGVESQREEQREEDPVAMFVEAIPVVLASGKAHVAGRDGEVPSDADAAGLGWQRRTSIYMHDRGNGEMEIGSSHLPLGNLIGWVDGEQLLLLPAPALQAVGQLLREQGKAIPVAAKTLGKRLRETGWLVELDKDGGAGKPVKICGTTVRVFVMSRHQVLDNEQVTIPAEEFPGTVTRGLSREKMTEPQM
jgi:hypothetical protein